MKCKWKNCLKEFETERECHAHLFLHVDESKINEKKYDCLVEKCEYKGNLRCRVKRHLMTHFNFYDFQCQKCAVGFKREKCLKNHLLKGYCQIDYKTRCNICDLHFRSKYKYKKHSMIHGEYFSNIVDWLFFNKI